VREVPLRDLMKLSINTVNLPPKFGKTGMALPYLIGYQAYINRLGFVGKDLERAFSIIMDDRDRQIANTLWYLFL
jgi:hypothetical protein